MANEELLPDIKNIKTQETFTLPSKGLLYKPEENIPTSITLRRMTTKEDKMKLRKNGLFSFSVDSIESDEPLFQYLFFGKNVNNGN